MPIRPTLKAQWKSFAGGVSHFALRPHIFSRYHRRRTKPNATRNMRPSRHDHPYDVNDEEDHGSVSLVGSDEENHNNRQDDDLDSLVDKMVVDHTLSNGDEHEEDAVHQEIKHVQQMTKRETLRIRIWRILIVLIIIGSGALVSWGTYNYLDDQLMDQTLDDVSSIHKAKAKDTDKSMHP